MNAFAIPPLIAFVSVLSIGIFVFFNNIRSKPHVTFGLLCFSASWWLFGFSQMYLATDSKIALEWARFGFLGIIFIPIFAYHFIVEFTNSSLFKKIVPFIYFLAIPSLIFSHSNFIYSGVKKHFYGFYPVAGQFYFIFLLMFAVLFLHGILLLYLSLRESKKTLKSQQIKYVLIAFAFGASGIIDYLVKYPIPIYPFGYLSAILLISTVAYAIVTTHLLDIEIVIKRTAVYSVLTALLTGVFVSLILVSNQFFGGLIGYNSIWPGIIGAFVIALLFQPLRDKVQLVVDNIFFRKRYDYQRILSKYSHALTQPMTDLDRFSNIAPYLLTKTMNLSGASVMVLDRSEHCFKIRAGKREAETLEGSSISEDSPLIKELYRRRRELNREEVREAEILKAMEELKAALIIPCISESEYFKEPTLIATINLGKKLSDESFSREDIDFLKTMANTATISIEYAFILEELKRNQEQIIKSEKLAALGTTAAGIAHELKNPLTYLLTVAQSMSQDWDNPTFKESVIKMFPSEVERMKLIIGGLSDYSKVQELRLEPIDVTIVLERALAILGYEIKKNNIYVIKKYPPEGEKKALALADKNRLVQVFMNVIANAVQAMGKGGDLSIMVREEENEVRVSISDPGPGIPQDKLQKIFDPFYTTKESGTGLGLSITKKIIEEHHGSIYVDSRVGEGTTFTICLPRAS